MTSVRPIARNARRLRRQSTDVELADERRTKLIGESGYRVILFWNNDVTENIDGVLETIREEAHLTPALSSGGGEGAIG